MPGIKKLAEKFEGRKAQFIEDISQGFAKVGRDIAAILRDKWLSGRRRGDMGLNIISGRLHDSIQSITEVDGRETLSSIFNRDAKYWYWNAGHSENHPNRFPVDRIFSDNRKRYVSVFEAAFARLAR